MKKKTEKEVRAFLSSIKLQLLSNYENNKTLLKVRCIKCGESFKRSFQHLQRYSKCPKCYPPKTARRNIDQVYKIIAENEGHILISKKYENQYTPLIIKCQITNESVTTYLKFFKKYGCKACNQKRVVDNLKEFKKRKLKEIKIEFEKEGYKLISKTYEDNKKDLSFICPQGHKGTTRWNNWMNGERCFVCKYEGFKGEGNPRWLGGLTDRNLVSYDTAFRYLEKVEQIRRDPEEQELLQAKCNYCGRWFRPTRTAVTIRRDALKTVDGFEGRLYCSEECKLECPIYHKRKWPAGFKKGTSREVQPELRQMVFDRDEWQCVKCGTKKSLQCHHIEGIKQNPIESADLDNCVTLCKKCHKWVHTAEGCQYFELRCN